ncbi:C-C motif chemokine 20-like [Protopterus annectens]|uniref:C-C motif chemokine 20-like n=1 Tax=Protopterus annectens TaxID=7888 RepID=UPI001CFBD3CA|nr:C-C motif chemokine 20-like [Protopterus annectens]
MKAKLYSCMFLVKATLVLLCTTFLFSDEAFAFKAFQEDCCLKHSEKPLPFRIIKGYIEQWSNEVCNIDAIVFHTTKGRKVCANPKDEWVKQVFKRLSVKLKNMSKAK